VSYNCLDRNIEAGLGDKTPSFSKPTTAQDARQLPRPAGPRVAPGQCTARQGVKKGDRVVIYLPMSIEGIVAMQACARIGATHSVVFGGFSAQSLRERISDAGAVMLITADEQCRGGKNIPLKPIVDEAFGMGGCENCTTVIVYKRTGGACNMVAGRDVWLHDV
jgi:acetyl-CoA synthetase